MDRPVFLVTHPRACSTAFERLFIAHPDFVCLHEPFDSPFYFGPERLSDRYNEDARLSSGCSHLTFGSAWNEIARWLGHPAAEGRRVFTKGMAFNLMPLNGATAAIAPSLVTPEAEAVHAATANPTVLPGFIWETFHLTFLIRHPRLSIPSLYKLSTPTLSSKTGWNSFEPSGAGYAELRRFFNWAIEQKMIGPHIEDQHHKRTVASVGMNICVIDAEDLLLNPPAIVEAYCKAIDASYDPDLLQWDTKEKYEKAAELLQAWTDQEWSGFHDVVLETKTLQPIQMKCEDRSPKQDYEDWVSRFGIVGAEKIQEAVDANMEHYLYLKEYCIRI